MGSLTRFERAGLTFDVLDSGPEQADAVVLLHGFPDEPGCWDGVTPALNAAGYRTLAPEQRGYGPRSRPKGRAAYRVEELVRDVLALIETVGAHRVHVVGHDWGAFVGWALAARHPERVSTLTSVSTPHPTAFGTAMVSSSQLLRSWYLAFWQLPWLPERMLSRGLGGLLRRTGLPPADADQLVLRMAEPGRLSGALGWYRALPFSLAEPTAEVRVPTTFVWGRHDPAIARAGAERTRDYVRAPYRFVELGGGHWLPYTHPVELSAVLLDRVRSVSRTT